MSKKIKVLERQTIWDLAIQEYGSIDGAFKILSDNPTLDLATDLVPGTLILINSLPINKDVVNTLIEKGIVLANKSSGNDYLLTEDGFYLLQENGFKIIL